MRCEENHHTSNDARNERLHEHARDTLVAIRADLAAHDQRAHYEHDTVEEEVRYGNTYQPHGPRTEIPVEEDLHEAQRKIHERELDELAHSSEDAIHIHVACIEGQAERPEHKDDADALRIFSGERTCLEHLHERESQRTHHGSERDHEEERIAQATRNKATEIRPIVTRGAIRKLGQERGAKRYRDKHHRATDTTSKRSST